MSVHNIVTPLSRILTQITSSTFVLVLACFMAVSTPSVFAAKAAEPSVVSAVVNINQATSEQMAQVLSGVGVKKAEAIVAYRAENGEFKTVDDLVKVKGIGESTLAKNRDRIEI